MTAIRSALISIAGRPEDTRRTTRSGSPYAMPEELSRALSEGALSEATARWGLDIHTRSV